MSQMDLNTIFIWGGACCLLVIGVGAHRAWRAGRNKLAILPLALLLSGLLVIPFVLGLFGIGAGGVWAGRAFIPLAAIVGGYLFFKFDGKSVL
jgi:hypothetical protein